MKEMLNNVCRATAVHIISRYGVLGEQEVVTIAKLPRRGVISSVIGRTDIRTQPTQDLIEGLFVVASRSHGKYTLQNQATGIELFGVPRWSIRKILECE
ncbi:hypothetical protein KJZ67_02650 [Patescibacteria group bacterium]|nr:hypothetical protein [Patescibacteria group bacterium]